jgi:uncharacterized protein YjiS (DUF1127 family)
MTDIAFDRTVFAPSAISRFRQLLDAFWRSFDRDLTAADTRRALNELPDNVLRDLGVVRGDIPFAASRLAHSAVVHHSAGTSVVSRGRKL